MKKTFAKKSLCLAVLIFAFILLAWTVNASAPSVTYPTEPTNGYVTVVISYPEGVVPAEGDTISYSIDGGSWQKYTEPFTVEKNCSVIATIAYADGSASAPATVQIGCIDKTSPSAPSITADTETWSAVSVSVTIVPGTDGGSGIARTEYRIGDSETWLEYTAPLSLTSSDTVYARTIDLAGNSSEISELNISNFDLTAPDTSSMKISFVCDTNAVVVDSGTFGTFFSSAVTARIEGAKDSESGLGGYEFQVVGKDSAPTPEGWVMYSPDSQPIISTDFAGFVYARAYDKVGNRSEPFMSDGLVVDTTAPVISDIALSTSALTDQRVDVTFNVTDNIRLDSVKVNDVYVGIYNQEFTAFKNGDYVVVATDKVGHTTTHTITISNIDIDSYSLIRMCESLSESDYTPSTWVIMTAALTELKTEMSVSTDQARIDALCDKVITALQGLVFRGDATESRELITKIASFDKELYTDSSWKAVDEAVSVVEITIANPESTQEDVDTVRASLELAVAELKLRADFTNLDRLISQTDALDASRYNPEKLQALRAKADEARNLSRTDSTQDQVDAMYNEMLILMSQLPDPVPEEKEPNYLLYFTLIVILILAVGAGLFLLISAIRRRKSEKLAAAYEDAYADEYDDYGSDSSIGETDIFFSDEDDYSDYNDYDE